MSEKIPISDTELHLLYDYFDPEKCADVEMVVSCGDLPAGYMEFIISMMNVPCYDVPGNHDTEFTKNPPPGWKPLDGQLVTCNGVTMLGLGVHYSDISNSHIRHRLVSDSIQRCEYVKRGPEARFSVFCHLQEPVWEMPL